VTLSSALSNPNRVSASALPNLPSTLDQFSGWSGTLIVVLPGASAYARGFDHQRSKLPLPLLLAHSNGRADGDWLHEVVSSGSNTTAPVVVTCSVTVSVPRNAACVLGANR